MRIQEVCRALALTKKAVEYYIKQELLTPKTLENGYRQFSEQDVERLRKISILRKLGLGIKEIKQALAEDGVALLRRKILQNEQRLMYEQLRQSLLAELSERGDWQEIEGKLRVLEQQETVSSKLLGAFPGEFGRFIALHFAQFLPDTIENAEQQAAYEEIISFLDDTATLSFPVQGQSTLDDQQPALDNQLSTLYDLQSALDAQQPTLENQQAMLSLSDWRQLSADMIINVQRAEQFLEENEESIKAYLGFKQSEQYLTSPAFQMQQLLRQFQQASGYYERFIPAMKRLSPAYREYIEQLEQASDALRAKYGDQL